MLDGIIWTYQDYQELPNDGKIYQIVEGTLFMTPVPTTTHQQISRDLEFLIWDYVRERNLGVVLDAPVDVVLSHTDIVQPDIVFISNERKKIIQERGIFGPPDLIVEILSPSTRKLDEQLKRDLYDRHGVREYLIVHPDERVVEHYRRQEGMLTRIATLSQDETISFHTIPGLVIELGQVFSGE